MTCLPTLVFETSEFQGKAHCHLQLDTVNTFDGVDLQEFDTYSSQTGWEYYDGADWQPFPAAGMSDTYSGNQVRYTLQDYLTEDVWYRRVCIGETRRLLLEGGSYLLLENGSYMEL